MANSEIICLTFTYQPEDHRRIVHMPSLSNNQVTISFGRMLMWLILMSLAIMEVLEFSERIAKNRTLGQGVETRMPEWSIWLIAILILSTSLSTYVAWAFFWNRRQRFADTTQESTQEVEISLTGVQWGAESHSAQYKWKYFNTYDESKTAFNLIGLHGSKIFIVPKRVMLPEQIELARKYFLENIRTDATKPQVGK